MENKIVLVAETGSDMPKELAQELGSRIRCHFSSDACIYGR